MKKTYNSLALAQDFPPVPGGVSVYTANLFKNWSGKVTILAPKLGTPCEENLPDNVSVKYLPLDLTRGGFGPFIKRQIRLYKASVPEIKNGGIDFVHCCHMSSGLAALLLKKIHGIPYVMYSYGSEITGQPGFLRQNLARSILKNASRISTMSRFTRGAIKGYGVDDKNIRFLVGINIDRFSRSGDINGTREKYNITGSPVILTAARLVPHKGIDTMIRAMPEIVKAYPDVQYVVIGEGEYRNELEKLIKEGRLEKNVRLIGHVPHEVLQDDTEAFYSVCDLYAMISRNIEGIEAEGFGLVFLEAGLSKKAVVGGNSGGIPDSVPDGVTGKLVNPEDPEALAECVLSLLNDRETMTKMGENGYKRAVEEFDWGKNVREWEQEVIEVIEAEQ